MADLKWLEMIQGILIGCVVPSLWVILSTIRNKIRAERIFKKSYPDIEVYGLRYRIGKKRLLRAMSIRGYCEEGYDYFYRGHNDKAITVKCHR